MYTFLPDETTSRPNEFARCKLFGEKDIVTSEITYNYVDRCRINNDYCNITGKYHEIAQ